MTIRYRLTPRARRSLSAIYRDVAEHSLRGADAVLQRIFDKIELAVEHQHIGVARPEISASARTLVAGSYIVIYEPGRPKLSVIAVVHGARDPETWLD